VDAEREVGRTRDVGWEIGVRRTVPAEPEAVWELLRSPEGMEVWLGGAIALEPGPYRLEDGTDGEVRVDAPGSHLRLTWRPPGWEEPSLVQVRVMPAAGGATIAFHQEHLADAMARDLMRERWTGVAEELRARLASARTGGGD
jgi:uncharacterized protein YndB with AHSA1/START domain